MLATPTVYRSTRGCDVHPNIRVLTLLFLSNLALGCGGGQSAGGSGYLPPVSPVFGGGDSGVTMAGDATPSASNRGDASAGQGPNDTASVGIDGAVLGLDSTTTSGDIAGQDSSSAATDVVQPDASTAGGPSDSGATTTSPTFAIIYSEVLVPYGCTSVLCHGAKADSPDQEIFLDQASAYDKLINKASKVKACQFLPIVLPGEPFKSVLYKKIAPGLVPCGDKMPIGSDGLAAEQAAMIKAWIEAGAKP